MAITVKCDECGKTVKAPDSAAGKKGKCPQCGAIIKIPELIYEAEEVDEDDEEESDRPRKSSSKSPFDDVSSFDAPPLPKAEKRKPCPVCGEMIVADAAKCRFCNEVFNKDLKKTTAKSADSNLSPAEIAIAILCGNIGCIVAIVWMIQGKPKGTKMLGVCVLAQVVIFIIFFIIGLIQQMSVN